MSGKNIESRKVVVLGVHGMAGHVMAEYLDGLGMYQVCGIARESGGYATRVGDVLNFPDLEAYLMHEKPDVVINCVGVLVSRSNGDVANAILVNAYLPNYLAALGLRLGYKLVHISTDCVFSGKDGGYTESSFRDGDDNYARTKTLGEVNNDRDLTIRTSIVGPELKHHGTGLLHWFLMQSGEIKGFTKAYWSGVTTLELAKAVHEMIKQDIRGIFQLCPGVRISKYELLLLFGRIWPGRVTILPNSEYAVDKSLISTRADFEYHEMEYEAMLREMKQWMDERPSYYKHYKM
jgi:dTDP-4-dehydrorhamnose reductase